MAKPNDEQHNDYLAWWGAVIATAVLGWDVYKWFKTGHPKLVVRARGNLQDAHSNNPQKHISIKVTNIGDTPTTLSLITFRYYNSKPSKWRKRQEAAQRGFFNPLRPTAPLLYKLDVGSEWSTIALQTADIEKMAREGYFYTEAEDTSSADSRRFARSRLLLN